MTQRLSGGAGQTDLTPFEGFEFQDRIEQGILAAIPDVGINGAGAERVPNTCNVTVRRVEGEALTLYLSVLGFALSSGSACAEGQPGEVNVI